MTRSGLGDSGMRVELIRSASVESRPGSPLGKDPRFRLEELLQALTDRRGVEVEARELPVEVLVANLGAGEAAIGALQRPRRERGREQPEAFATSSLEDPGHEQPIEEVLFRSLSILPGEKADVRVLAIGAQRQPSRGEVSIDFGEMIELLAREIDHRGDE